MWLPWSSSLAAAGSRVGKSPRSAGGDGRATSSRSVTLPWITAAPRIPRRLDWCLRRCSPRRCRGCCSTTSPKLRPLLGIDHHLQRRAWRPSRRCRRDPAWREVDERQDLAAVLDDLVGASALSRSRGNSSRRATSDSGMAMRLSRAAPGTGAAPASRRRRARAVARAVDQVAVAHLGDHVRALGDAQHVEDEGDAAVAHDGGAGERGERLELLAERLDDDLLGVAHPVDDEAELAVVGLQHDDVDRPPSDARLTGELRARRFR